MLTGVLVWWWIKMSWKLTLCLHNHLEAQQAPPSTSTSPFITLAPKSPIATMTVTEAIKSAVGIEPSAPRRMPPFFYRNWAVLTPSSRDSRRDEQCETAACLQRQLRQSFDPIESVSVWGVLSAMEVRGTLPTAQGDCDGAVQGEVCSVSRVRGWQMEQTERHSYEKCQYLEFKKRVAKMDELRAAKNGERSN